MLFSPLWLIQLLGRNHVFHCGSRLRWCPSQVTCSPSGYPWLASTQFKSLSSCGGIIRYLFVVFTISQQIEVHQTLSTRMLNNFSYSTYVHECCGVGEGIWGEHSRKTSFIDNYFEKLKNCKCVEIEEVGGCCTVWKLERKMNIERKKYDTEQPNLDKVAWLLVCMKNEKSL